MTSLVKKLDAQIIKNAKLKGYTVILTEDADATEGKLKELAKKEGIKKMPLTIFDGSQAGPPAYMIAKDAEVTVHFWAGRKVKANFAFKAGELDAAAIDKIVAEVPKVLE